MNFWVAGTTALKALIQLVTLKLIATYLGAEGLGIYGQAASCVVALNSLFSSGLLNFSVSEMSRNIDRPPERRKIGNVIGLWVLSVQVLFLVAAFFFAEQLSQKIFQNSSSAWFFYALAAISIFFNLHSVSTGFLSAFGDVKKIFKAHLFAFFTAGLILYLSVEMFFDITPMIAAFAVLASQSVWLTFFVMRTGRIAIKDFKPAYDRNYIIKILKFTLIMIVTGLLGMCYQIYMRNEILKIPLHGWSDVGEWQAILKISEITMSFLGLSIMTSYFPELSKMTQLSEIQNYVRRFSMRFGILILASLLFLAIFAGPILHLIYDKSFANLSALLRLQLLGDVFKLSGWIFTYFFLAKAPLLLFLGFEVISLITLTGLSLYLTSLYGVQGLIYAHCLNSALFFTSGLLLYLFITRKAHHWIR